MPQTQENQWLMPLAASIVCREANLPPEQSIALTAAAWLIDGPLALAPAIVAVERSREDSKPRKGESKPQTTVEEDPIGLPMVNMPKLVGRKRDRAITVLHQHGLRAHVILEPGTAGIVIRQFPAFVEGGRLDPGTHVTLHVGTGPADTKQSAPAVPAVANQTEQAAPAKA
jgi:hypothetical protein